MGRDYFSGRRCFAVFVGRWAGPTIYFDTFCRSGVFLCFEEIFFVKSRILKTDRQERRMVQERCLDGADDQTAPVEKGPVEASGRQVDLSVGAKYIRTLRQKMTSMALVQFEREG